MRGTSTGAGRPAILFAVIVSVLWLLGGTSVFAAAPLVSGESVLSVTSGSATFQAQVDPGGFDTRYKFEYGPSEAYGRSAPLVEGDAGEGLSPVTVEAHVQGLLPGAVYHFRVVAQSSVTEGGQDRTFTTEVVGGGSLLDGRAWELVSPPQKEGVDVLPLNGGAAGGVTQASATGNAITYQTLGPTVADPEGNRALEPSQVLSMRGFDGWSSQDITTPSDAASGVIGIGGGSEYRFFSSSLALAALEPPGSLLLPPPPEISAASERTIYVRDNQPLSPEASARQTSLEAESDGGYVPLVTAMNVTSGEKFGGNPEESFGDIVFVDATPDLNHVVLHSRGVPLLDKNPPPDRTESLYEWSGGQLQPIAVLPPGDSGPEVSPGLGALLQPDTRHAISNDGLRIDFSAEDNHTKHLFLRDMSRGETIQVDVIEPGAEGGSNGNGPEFQTASADGSRVFFTDPSRLTVGSTAKNGSTLQPDLYVFEVTSGPGEKLAGRLTDLTKDPGSSAPVLGDVLGANEAGSVVYFVSSGVLPGAEENSEGENAVVSGFNLYASRDSGAGWVPAFVAGLSPKDSPDWGETASAASFNDLSARVSPNGLYLAFMSQNNLTGYDNLDANSGKPDEEVFLYDASANHLVCASCDPTGARPVGLHHVSNSAVPLLIDPSNVWETQWLAASIPSWTKLESRSSLYQSRYLSDSGRLFFDSADALVPQDTNGREDVYEYEPLGVGGTGGCTEASPMFSKGSGGCVGLISSGTSSEETVFLDASETGGDVFFLTSEKLVGQDPDEAFDVYDAHECTGASPCLAPVALARPPCDTADACRAASPPQPEIFGPAGSATFTGAGNPPLSVSESEGGGQKLKPKHGKTATHKHKKRKKGRKAAVGRLVRRGK